MVINPVISHEVLGPRTKGSLAPSSISSNNDTQTKSSTVYHKQGSNTTKMHCDLENSFLLVYLFGPLIIINGPRGAAPAAPSQYSTEQRKPSQMILNPLE